MTRPWLRLASRSNRSTTWHDLTWHYMKFTWHYITLYYVTLHITPHYLTPHYITLDYMTLHGNILIRLDEGSGFAHDMTWLGMALHYMPFYYITFYYITSHHITLHYIKLHHITSASNSSLPSAGPKKWACNCISGPQDAPGPNKRKLC